MDTHKRGKNFMETSINKSKELLKSMDRGHVSDISMTEVNKDLVASIKEKLEVISSLKSIFRVLVKLLQANQKVSFTGSMEVGREIMHAAASSNLKQVSLELVGKSPLLIFDDADVDKAASLALLGIVYNKGEICVESSVCLFRKGMCSIIILKDGFRQGFLLEELFWNCLLECWMTTRVISLALQFVEEETGIKFKLEDMVDLTAFLDSSTGCRFFPSPTVDYKRPTYEEVENLQALLPRECNIYQMQIGEMASIGMDNLNP